MYTWASGLLQALARYGPVDEACFIVDTQVDVPLAYYEDNAICGFEGGFRKPSYRYASGYLGLRGFGW